MRPAWCDRVQNVNRSFGVPPPLPPKPKDRRRKPVVDCNKPVSMDAPIRKLSLQRVLGTAGRPRRKPVARRRDPPVDAGRCDTRGWGDLYRSVYDACNDAGAPLTITPVIDRHRKPPQVSFGAQPRSEQPRCRVRPSTPLNPYFDPSDEDEETEETDSLSNNNFEDVKTWESESLIFQSPTTLEAAEAARQPLVFFTEPVHIDHSVVSTTGEDTAPTAESGLYASECFESESDDDDPPSTYE